MAWLLGGQKEGRGKMSEPKPCIAYDKDGQCIAVGDSINDLARQLGITPAAVSHGLHRGCTRYAYIEEDKENDEERDKGTDQSISCT